MGAHPRRPTRVSLRLARSDAPWCALWDWLLAADAAVPQVSAETPNADVDVGDDNGKASAEDPEDI